MADDRAPSRKSSIRFALLGIAIGLLSAIAILLAFSKKKAPPVATSPKKLAGSVLREDSGALDEILVHYVPRLEPLIADAYVDFLGTLSPATRLVVVVPKEDGAQAALD